LATATINKPLDEVVWNFS